VASQGGRRTVALPQQLQQARLMVPIVALGMEMGWLMADPPDLEHGGAAGALPVLLTCETCDNVPAAIPGPRGPHFSLAMSGPLNPARAVTPPAWACYPDRYAS
jgi:hypothetical protein